MWSEYLDPHFRTPPVKHTQLSGTADINFSDSFLTENYKLSSVH